MRTILLVALLLLPGLTRAEETLLETRIAMGDRLAQSDTPLDLKAAILCYEQAIELAPGHGAAAKKIARAKARLRELARPARERATTFLSYGDAIEAERYLCEAISIDPFDRELWPVLAEVRTKLRREAVELHETILQRQLLRPDSLGVPPEAERFTNDPRFVAPARESHRG